MATTIPAVMALLRTPTAINNCPAWELLPIKPITVAQRATAITAILGGTVTTEADCLALVATAAVAGVSEKQIYELMSHNAGTVG